jgi:acylphosphatase
MTEIQHKIVHFSGRVQGVGFRFNVSQIAREYDVSGFVKNCPDGRVELQVEGTDKDIKAFVEMISERMHGYIRQVEKTGQLRKPEFVGFKIR